MPFWFVEGYRALGVAGMIGGFGLGIVAGTLVLARVLNRTDGSVLAAVLWHATYNLTSATAASRGIIGAVTTTPHHGMAATTRAFATCHIAGRLTVVTPASVLFTPGPVAQSGHV